jgi:hypothetical protein
MISFIFNPAFAAGDPGTMLLMTGSCSPQFELLLISKEKPKLHVSIFVCACIATIATKLKKEKIIFFIRFSLLFERIKTLWFKIYKAKIHIFSIFSSSKFIFHTKVTRKLYT